MVPVLFTFYIQGVLKLKKIIPAPKGLFMKYVEINVWILYILTTSADGRKSAGSRPARSNHKEETSVLQWRSYGADTVTRLVWGEFNRKYFHILGAFAKLRKAISASSCLSVRRPLCLSVCLSVHMKKKSIPKVGFSPKLIFEYFSKIFPKKNPSFIETWQE